MSSVHNEKWVCFLLLCKTLVDLSVLDYKQMFVHLDRPYLFPWTISPCFDCYGTFSTVIFRRVVPSSLYSLKTENFSASKLQEIKEIMNLLLKEIFLLSNPNAIQKIANVSLAVPCSTRLIPEMF